MRLTTPKFWGLCILALVLAFAAQPAKAAYQVKTYTFTQSNVLADGVNYGTVKVESYDGIGATGGSLLTGQIRLTVTAATAPYTAGLGSNFGIQDFGFNFLNLSINTAAEITANVTTVPTTWTFTVAPSGGGFGEFGQFNATDTGTGHSRANPIAILISNQGTNALIANVTRTIGGTPASYFAAHVADFNTINGQESHKIAVTNLSDNGGLGDAIATPAPAGFVLLVSALPVFGLRRLIRRKRTA